MSTVQRQTTKQFVENFHQGNPFYLDNEKAYQLWREMKLENYPEKVADIIVEINNPAALTDAEFNAIQSRLLKTNMAVYAGNTGSNADKSIAVKLTAQFGLSELDDSMAADDGITSLKVISGRECGAYIPYTNKAIQWHTDGYYNALDQQISSLFLHCISPAADGGENALLDHEIAYIHLRDKNPDYIEALMAKDVMSIPANIEKGEEIRPARIGPVFSVMPDGNLHMRYTARSFGIEWKKDSVTKAAVKTLGGFLSSNSPYIYRTTLQPGEGLISNNVLHDRSGFEDTEDVKRLLYRLRYYQRLANT
ncbi:MAG: TauD/TfdA family dioxygenase [Gammaproteobacteria bacterium]